MTNYQENNNHIFRGIMINEHELENLKRHGIQFTVHLFDGHHDLTSKEVIEYINSPELVEAKAHGATLENWKKGKEHINYPKCHAITKKRQAMQRLCALVKLKRFYFKRLYYIL
jgi:hypothetical protein